MHTIFLSNVKGKSVDLIFFLRRYTGSFSSFRWRNGAAWGIALPERHRHQAAVDEGQNIYKLLSTDAEVPCGGASSSSSVRKVGYEEAASWGSRKSQLSVKPPITMLPLTFRESAQDHVIVKCEWKKFIIIKILFINKNYFILFYFYYSTHEKN